MHTVAAAERVVLLPPAPTQRVHIATTDTTSLDLDIYIVVTKRLELVLILVEFKPRCGTIDLKASGSFWVNHNEVVSDQKSSEKVLIKPEDRRRFSEVCTNKRSEWMRRTTRAEKL
jgi:hypothetical protein